MNLSAIEKKILLEMLGSLDHCFSIAGCNDFDLPNDAQHRALMEQVLRRAYEAETLESELKDLTEYTQRSKTIRTTDTLILGYLKARIQELPIQ